MKNHNMYDDNFRIYFQLTYYLQFRSSLIITKLCTDCVIYLFIVNSSLLMNTSIKINRLHCKYINIIICQLLLVKIQQMKSYDWQSQASSTQRIATMKRTYKQAFHGIPPQQDLITQVARIRLIQDQLFTQRMKVQSLERKNIEYIETVAQLEYAVGDLKFMLEKAEVQLKKYYDADHVKQQYALSLKEVGQQIAMLNQVLEKKNKQCHKLTQTNTKLKQQNTKLQQKILSYEQIKQQQKTKLKDILKLLTNNQQSSLSGQILRNMDFLQQQITQLKNNLIQTKNTLQKSRKQHSQILILEKQNIISLQYQLKLVEKRNQDLEKKKNMEATLTIDKRVQDIIQDMLKKQDQLSLQIAELQNQNQTLKQQIQSQKMSSNYYVELKQNDYEKQLKSTKQIIKHLSHEKQTLKQKIEELNNLKEIQTNRSMNEQVQINRKYRQCNQENKRLKLKINQLESDKKILQKQLSIRNFSY